MKKLRLYLETSVWNFYFADDAPEKRDVTKEFFQAVFDQAYEIYISEVVLDEISLAPEPRRTQLYDLIGKCLPADLDVQPEAENLARKYVVHGIVPEKKEEDALHVAVASLAEMDALITWNFRHLANFKKTELFHAVNVTYGYYKKVAIVTPMEVLKDEN